MWYHRELKETLSLAGTTLWVLEAIIRCWQNSIAFTVKIQKVSSIESEQVTSFLQDSVYPGKCKNQIRMSLQNDPCHNVSTINVSSYCAVVNILQNEHSIENTFVNMKQSFPYLPIMYA